MKHAEFVTSILRTVRASGAADALQQLRSDRPEFDDGRYHDTRAVFFVWAVDRLVAGGLSDSGVMWHPLVDDRSPLVWWSAATLDSAEAVVRFVSSDLARTGEPQPAEPMVLTAA